MRDYVINLDDYGIGAERYLELKHFCYQYPIKKQRLAEMLHASPAWGEYSGKTGPGDPVAAIVAQRDRLLKDCEDVEQSAIEAVGYVDERIMYQRLLLYVTSKKAVQISDLPCGRRQFFEMRKRFFAALDRRR